MSKFKGVAISVAKGVSPYAVPLTMMLFTLDASAGTVQGAYTSGSVDGGEFNSIGEKFDGWITGSYGKTIALGASIGGLAAAGFSKTFVPAVWGLGIAAAAMIVPKVIGSFFSAVI